MSKHTPGPWEAIPPKKTGKHWKVGAHGKLGGSGSAAGATALWFVAQIDNGAPGDTLETEGANARLIAAAPDLLAAAKAMFELAHLAGCLWLRDQRNPCLCGSHDRVLERERDMRAAIAKAEGNQ